MKICVVGLGKIGLPLAVQFTLSGHQVLGCDIDPRVVDTVNRGIPGFPGEADLGSRLRAAISGGNLVGTTDTVAAVRHSEAVVVIVPLAVDDQDRPDFRALDAATSAIATGLRPGTLIVYETTVPVGTTRGRCLPMLEDGSGMARSDFLLAYSPERVFSGRVFSDLRRYPKLLGGLNEESSKAAKELYESSIEFEERSDLPEPNGVWVLDSLEAAELAKLAETTYRDVNIGLANQFARYAETIGVDIHQVIRACNSQPYSHIHKPGPGVGGHCIPVYSKFYTRSDPSGTIVRAARTLNADQPRHVAEMLTRALGQVAGARVAILGVSYRAGVKEASYSGAITIAGLLAERGATVMAHDPYFSDDEVRALGLVPYRTGDEVDAAIIHTDHKQYRSLRPADLPAVKVMIDGRAVVDSAAWEGVDLYTVGVGRRPPPGIN